MSTDTLINTGTEVLESLDFSVPCGHSQHEMGDQAGHSGDAEFIARVTHDCPVDRHQGNIYPCCAAWAAYVQARADEFWRCPHCKMVSLGREMVVIMGSLNIM